MMQWLISVWVGVVSLFGYDLAQAETSFPRYDLPHSRGGICHIKVESKFGMVIGMDKRILKTIANKLGCAPGGRIENNPIWPSLEHKNLIYQLILPLESSVIPIFQCF